MYNVTHEFALKLLTKDLGPFAAIEAKRIFNKKFGGKPLEFTEDGYSEFGLYLANLRNTVLKEEDRWKKVERLRKEDRERRVIINMRPRRDNRQRNVRRTLRKTLWLERARTLRAAKETKDQQIAQYEMGAVPLF